MEEYRGENKIVLRGQVAGAPALSHRNHGIDYYIAPFRVPRLSGTDDTLNLIAAAPDADLWAVGNWLTVQGEVRSYNNRSGQGSKLVGRRTPLGREICDLLLAVNRPYGRADYLPCIAWGSLAAHCGELPVGSMLRLEGRLQSRQYHKVIDGEQVTRTAFEVSVMNLLPEEDGI